ncbi:MAG: GNAT family N-acetyltransferase [Gammaproteobacteria bacterium]|nr:GNAT family N-acetyltransferase [Gammaproteobacteria bacterium]MDH3410938.1 GNAT family N-acetyltransferase [Gammaproteobacteria bacterium]
MRDALVEDAEFILSLRLDPSKSKYLSGTSAQLEDQVNWLRSYAEDDKQAYFIVCDKASNELGCVRMYDPSESSYCWGSWIMISGLSPHLLIEAPLLIYAYGKWLGFDQARFSVRKGNTHVWKFHENVFAAERIRETQMDYCYVLEREKIDAGLKKYAQLITNPLIVNP